MRTKKGGHLPATLTCHARIWPGHACTSTAERDAVDGGLDQQVGDAVVVEIVAFVDLTFVRDVAGGFVGGHACGAHDLQCITGVAQNHQLVVVRQVQHAGQVQLERVVARAGQVHRLEAGKVGFHVHVGQVQRETGTGQLERVGTGTAVEVVVAASSQCKACCVLATDRQAVVTAGQADAFTRRAVVGNDRIVTIEEGGAHVALGQIHLELGVVHIVVLAVRGAARAGLARRGRGEASVVHRHAHRARTGGRGHHRHHPGLAVELRERALGAVGDRDVVGVEAAHRLVKAEGQRQRCACTVDASSKLSQVSR